MATRSQQGDAGRLAGLDAWRGMLMIGGLFVHASSWVEPQPLFAAVALVSATFRMGVFFAISGYLTACALQRRQPGLWLRRRIAQLGVPAIFGMMVFSPLVWALVLTRHPAASGHLPLPFEWHHLWFLFGLIIYSVIAVALDRADRRHDWIARALPGGIRRPGSARALLLAVALANALLFGASVPMIQNCLPAPYYEPFGNVQLIAGYLPMFFLGFVLSRRTDLRDAVLANWRVAGGIVVATFTAAIVWTFAALPGVEYLHFVGAALCPPAALVLVLRSALSIRRVPAILQSASDASYTIYVLHLPIAVAFNTRAPALGLGPHAIYACCILVSGLGSWAVHRWLVRGSATATLLLNGRLPQFGRGRSVDEACDHIAVAAADLHLAARA